MEGDGEIGVRGMNHGEREERYYFFLLLLPSPNPCGVDFSSLLWGKGVSLNPSADGTACLLLPQPCNAVC